MNLVAEKPPLVSQRCLMFRRNCRRSQHCLGYSIRLCLLRSSFSPAFYVQIYAHAETAFWRRRGLKQAESVVPEGNRGQESSGKVAMSASVLPSARNRHKSSIACASASLAKLPARCRRGCGTTRAVSPAGAFEAALVS